MVFSLLVDTRELEGLPELCEEAFSAGGLPLTCATFNASGTLLAAGSSFGHVLVFDYQTRSIVRAFEGHGGRQVAAVTWAHDGGAVVSAGADGRLVVRDLRTELVVLDFDLGRGPISSVHLRPRAARQGVAAGGPAPPRTPAASPGDPIPAFSPASVFPLLISFEAGPAALVLGAGTDGPLQQTIPAAHLERIAGRGGPAGARLLGQDDPRVAEERVAAAFALGGHAILTISPTSTALFGIGPPGASEGADGRRADERSEGAGSGAAGAAAPDGAGADEPEGDGARADAGLPRPGLPTLRLPLLDLRWQRARRRVGPLSGCASGRAFAFAGGPRAVFRVEVSEGARGEGGSAEGDGPSGDPGPAVASAAAWDLAILAERVLFPSDDAGSASEAGLALPDHEGESPEGSTRTPPGSVRAQASHAGAFSDVVESGWAGAAISPRGGHVAGLPRSSAHVAYVWDSRTGGLDRVLEASRAAGRCVAAVWHPEPSPSQLLTVGGRDGQLLVWARAHADSWGKFAPGFEELEENREARLGEAGGGGGSRGDAADAPGTPGLSPLPATPKSYPDLDVWSLSADDRVDRDAGLGSYLLHLPLELPPASGEQLRRRPVNPDAPLETIARRSGA